MAYDPASAARQKHVVPSFTLESGVPVTDFAISYIVHGTPAADGSNVVLALSSLGGNAHRLDFMIGDGLPLDPAKFCTIAVDAIGNGHSASPSNSAAHPGMQFPQYNIRDMVASQRLLLEEVFGLTRIFAVIGASMGGMQALQWAVSHPQAMQAIIALVPLAKTPPWTLLANEISRRIVMADPAWNGGDYASRDFPGWRAALAYGNAVVSRSPDSVNAEVPSAQTSAWLDEQVDHSLIHGFDPNDWIMQTRAYDQHDLGTTPGFDGDTAAALGSIQVPTLVMGPELDLLNPGPNQREVASGIPGARFVHMPSNRGHLAANVGDERDIDQINDEAAAFLAALFQNQAQDRSNQHEI